VPIRTIPVTVELRVRGPFDLAASMRFLEGFTPAARSDAAAEPGLLRLAFPAEAGWLPVGAAIRQRGGVAAWHSIAMDATVVVGRQGRLVIPAEVRAALGLSAGDRLHLNLAGGRLVLQRPQDAVRELRRLGNAVPRTRSLVDELLAERRVAAAAE